MQIVVQQLVTNYTRVGKGKQVLILHGWGDDSQSWLPFAKALGKDYECIVPDLPGFGGTEPPTSVWNLKNYAEFMRDFLQKIEVKPYAIIGHSNGGAIAIKALGQGLVQSDKLLLLASAGVRGEDRKTGLKVVAKIGKAVSRPLPKKIRSRLRTALYKKSGSDLLVAEHLETTFKRIVADDVREDAAYLSTPTLLVYGELDPATPLRYGIKLKEVIEGSQLKTIADAGHFLHIDTEHQVLTITREFLRA